MAYCPRCSRNNPDSAEFCAFCGQNMAAGGVAGAASAEPPAESAAPTVSAPVTQAMPTPPPQPAYPQRPPRPPRPPRAPSPLGLAWQIPDVQALLWATAGIAWLHVTPVLAGALVDDDPKAVLTVLAVLGAALGFAGLWYATGRLVDLRAGVPGGSAGEVVPAAAAVLGGFALVYGVLLAIAALAT